MTNPDKGCLIKLTCGMMNTVCVAGSKSKSPEATLECFPMCIAKDAVLQVKTAVAIAPLKIRG